MIEAPPVGSKPREWTELPDEHLITEIPLMIIAADCAEAVAAAVRGDELSAEHLAALGRINFYAYLKSLAPPFALLTIKTMVDPHFAYGYRQTCEGRKLGLEPLVE